MINGGHKSCFRLSCFLLLFLFVVGMLAVKIHRPSIPASLTCSSSPICWLVCYRIFKRSKTFIRKGTHMNIKSALPKILLNQDILSIFVYFLSSLLLELTKQGIRDQDQTSQEIQLKVVNTLSTRIGHEYLPCRYLMKRELG